MKVREYRLMDEAVEAGVARGWRMAHKHVDAPTPEAIQEAMEREVMTEICERFIFEPEDEN